MCLYVFHTHFQRELVFMNIFMRFPQGKAKALTFSYDDANRSDIRLVEIFNKYGLKGTFNINTGLMQGLNPKKYLTLQEAKELYESGGHETAAHAETHPYLEQLPTILALREILKDRAEIEDSFGVITRGMAYPFGTYSDEVIQVLKSAGIVYSRIVDVTENFDMPRDWLRLKGTCHHNNPRLFEFAEKFVTRHPDTNYYQKSPWMFYVWGHSFEFDNNDNWDVIEKFAQFTGGKDDVWYATNIEIYEYEQAYKSLVFSCDGKMVKNPTAYDVWFLYENNSFDCSDRLFKVPSGKCVRID